MIFERFLEKRRMPSLADLDGFLDYLVGGRGSAAGVSVTPDTALGSTAVYNAITILTGSLASLPLVMYRRLERGKERATYHPLYRILHDLPNPEMTSMNMREALQGHLLLRGNAYAEIVRDGRGAIVQIWPLRPDRMSIKRNDRGELEYLYQVGAEYRTLRKEQVWHIPGLGYDGVGGYSPIKLAQDAIGLSLATQEFGARFFANGSRPGGILVHPNKLTEEGAKRLRESWEKAQGGLTNSHRVAVLEEGIEWKQIGMAPEEAQFLETRRFQVEEIARIFNLPPHKLKDLSRATFSNIEEQSIEFVQDALRPWAVRWEQSIYRCLLTETEQREFFAEHLFGGLLRGDLKNRYEAYAVGRQNGWLSANDIREMENQNPIDNGDMYLVPLNMVPADMVASGAIDQSEPGNPEDQDDGNRQVRSMELRQLRSVTTRRRIANSYKKVFEDAVNRIVRREKADVMRTAEKLLGKRSVDDFLSWLDEFYKDHEEFINRNMAPVYQSMAESIQAEAADEIGAEVGIDDRMQTFIAAYLAAYVARHVGSSRGQLKALVDEIEPEELLSAIDQRLTEWEEKRAVKVAAWEAVRFDNAVALATYKANGKAKKRWVTQGTSSCPYCKSLDGKTIKIDDPFVRQADKLQPEGVDEPLTFTGDYLHSPIHQGCDCAIVSA